MLNSNTSTSKSSPSKPLASRDPTPGSLAVS